MRLNGPMLMEALAVPPPVSTGTTAVQVWTLILAGLAVTATLVSAYLLRRTGRGTVEAAKKAAEASERSAQAAQEAVSVNRETSTGVAQRAHADALSKRYQDAAIQLGHTSAAVRLAGVYAMALLADDWPQQRQMCIDVLCAYLRLADRKPTSAEEDGETEVCAAILSLILEHYRVGAPNEGWRKNRLDLHGVTLHDVRLKRLRFEAPVSLRGVRFTGECVIDWCRFEGGADISGWSITGGRLEFELPTSRSKVPIVLAGGQVNPGSSFVPTFRMYEGDHGFAVDLSRLTIDSGSLEFCVERFHDARSIDLSYLTIRTGSQVNFSMERRFSFGPDEYEWQHVGDSPFLDPRAELWTVDEGAQVRINPELFGQPGWPLRAS